MSKSCDTSIAIRCGVGYANDRKIGSGVVFVSTRRDVMGEWRLNVNGRREGASERSGGFPLR
ncbi:MAG TPA: hypothetical protein VND66_12450 [Acidobacteriaceae bacterium]|nr:hypothetical protein [Acidobacteriaceae bacterium]